MSNGLASILQQQGGSGFRPVGMSPSYLQPPPKLQLPYRSAGAPPLNPILSNTDIAERFQQNRNVGPSGLPPDPPLPPGVPGGAPRFTYNGPGLLG